MEKKESLELPWTCDPADLPGSLPTLAQIEAAQTVFPSIYTKDIRRTVLVNDLFVVKYGPIVSENEGHALWLVEKMPRVPAPRLYAMFRDDINLYIVMEYIRGHRLCDIWSRLVDAEKFAIAAQLKQTCDRFRNTASPGFFGGALGTPVPHRYFFSSRKDSCITGPFSTEEEFSQTLALQSANYWKSSARHGWLSDYFSRHLASAFNGHDSVFTHADFQAKNIIVREMHMASDHAPLDVHRFRSFRLAAIIDWESAGWYPRYWEYASCFISSDWSDEWMEKMDRVFQPYVKEAALLKIVSLDLDT